MTNRLTRTTPEAQGIPSSAILQFINAAEEQIQELHSFTLVRHGSVVAEGWWSPYAAELPHILFSLSKSFTSSAIGLAVAEGLLSVDDKVISFFPDETPANPSKNLAAMTVHDLLSMSSGHETEPSRTESTQWVKHFLEHPVVYPPGTHFVYNSIATYMLSAIIQKLTGTMLLDYLKPRLLDPLGIENATWEVSPEGINTGGWGLKIKTEDIAVFGQMYLQKGMWQEERILSEAWIEQATSKQVDNGSDPNNDWNQGYGYQFWRCRHGAYRGDGAFGQYCIVMQEQDAVLAITSGVSDMQSVLNLVWDCLLPAMAVAPLPANAADAAALQSKQSSLVLKPPSGAATSPTAARVSGRTFKADANALKVESVTLNFSASVCVITANVAGVERHLTCGYGAWRNGIGAVLGEVPPEAARLIPSNELPVVASGVWTADDTFQLTTRFYETPYYTTATFRFGADQVTIATTANVTFIPNDQTFVARLT